MCERQSMSETSGPIDTPWPWFALSVRTRQEPSIAAQLSHKGYQQFLPLYKCRKRWSDRIVEVEMPLFPGYLFCRFDPQDRLPILKTPGVAQIVGVGRIPVPVSEGEISALQALVSSGLPSRPWQFLHAGDRVRIEAGPLQGAEGLLVSFKGGYRLILSITLLQRAVAVEIDSACVTLVQRAHRLERASYDFIGCQPQFEKIQVEPVRN